MAAHPVGTHSQAGLYSSHALFPGFAVIKVIQPRVFFNDNIKLPFFIVFEWVVIETEQKEAGFFSRFLFIAGLPKTVISLNEQKTKDSKPVVTGP